MAVIMRQLLLWCSVLLSVSAWTSVCRFCRTRPRYLASPTSVETSIIASPLFKQASLLETEGFVAPAIAAFQIISTKFIHASSAERAYIELRLAHLENDGHGNLVQAEVHLRNALSFDNEAPSAVIVDQLGCILATQKCDNVESVFRKAVDLLPSGSDLRHWGPRFHLAVVQDLESQATWSLSSAASFASDGIPAEAIDSWEYARQNFNPDLLTTGVLYNGTRAVLAAATSFAAPLLQPSPSSQGGLVFEFGVSYGKSIRMLAELTSECRGSPSLSAKCIDPNDILVTGFDTFTGLPEAWGNEAVGTYSTGGSLPLVPFGVELVQGLFADTLGPYLDAMNCHEPRRPIAVANIDCDLYQATVDILHELGSRPGLIVPGTILVFDEYFMYEGWREDEHKAFQEACSKFGWQYEYVAWSLASKQVAARITSVAMA
mmetsp:Transcript_89032/g.172473  ORF Transcript_89032/g.172473 Transcript_89032/m.172473 type:complete len:433 (+) Transcript_89032:22-1320(+)